MNMLKQELIATFIEIGNGIQGHRVSGTNKTQINKNVKRVFANARKRIDSQNLVAEVHVTEGRNTKYLCMEKLCKE